MDALELVVGIGAHAVHDKGLAVQVHVPIPRIDNGLQPWLVLLTRATIVTKVFTPWVSKQLQCHALEHALVALLVIAQRTAHIIGLPSHTALEGFISAAHARCQHLLQKMP